MKAHPIRTTLPSSLSWKKETRTDLTARMFCTLRLNRHFKLARLRKSQVVIYYNESAPSERKRQPQGNGFECRIRTSISVVPEWSGRATDTKLSIHEVARMYACSTTHPNTSALRWIFTKLTAADTLLQISFSKRSKKKNTREIWIGVEGGNGREETEREEKFQANGKNRRVKVQMEWYFFCSSSLGWSPNKHLLVLFMQKNLIQLNSS